MKWLTKTRDFISIILRRPEYLVVHLPTGRVVSRVYGRTLAMDEASELNEEAMFQGSKATKYQAMHWKHYDKLMYMGMIPVTEMVGSNG